MARTHYIKSSKIASTLERGVRKYWSNIGAHEMYEILEADFWHLKRGGAVVDRFD